MLNSRPGKICTIKNRVISENYRDDSILNFTLKKRLEHLFFLTTIHFQVISTSLADVVETGAFS